MSLSNCIYQPRFLVAITGLTLAALCSSRLQGISKKGLLAQASAAAVTHCALRHLAKWPGQHDQKTDYKVQSLLVGIVCLSVGRQFLSKKVNCIASAVITLLSYKELCHSQAREAQPAAGEAPAPAAQPAAGEAPAPAAQPAAGEAPAPAAQPAAGEAPAPEAQPGPSSLGTPAGALLATAQEAEDDLYTHLKNFFVISDQGQITSCIANAKTTKESVEKCQVLPTLFYNLALKGNAALAHHIMRQLAYLNIASFPVDKNNGEQILCGTARAYSFTPTGYDKKEPNALTPGYGKNKKQPAYLGLWEYNIWKGYKEYRKQSGTLSQKNQDHTEHQLSDYYRRKGIIEKLHNDGYLLARSENPDAVEDLLGHRFRMLTPYGRIMCTSLLPAKDSSIDETLFTQGLETLGVLFNPFTVGKNDIGLSWPMDAYTSGDFLAHLQRKKEPLASTTLNPQRLLLKAFDDQVKGGGKVSDVIWKDHSGQPLKNPDGTYKTTIKIIEREGAVDFSSQSQASKTVPLNEATFYRGVAGQMLEGFFLKSGADDFSQTLTRLFEVQDRARRYKGRFYPIYILNGQKNILREIVPDELMLALCGLHEKIKPMPNDIKSELSQAFEAAGIDTAIAVAMRKALPAGGTVKKLFDLQLLMINMKDIEDKLNIKQEAPGQFHHPTYAIQPVSMLDNLHLVFPTLFKTQNPSAQQSELFFLTTDVESIKKNPDLLKYIQATLRYNLKTFLKLSILPSGEASFDKDVLNLFDRSDLKNEDFAKVLSRAVQSAVLFSIFGEDTPSKVKALVCAVRIYLPFLGLTPSGIDLILGNAEIQQITGTDLSLIDKAKQLPTSLPSTAPKSYPVLVDMNTIDPFSLSSSVTIPPQANVYAHLKTHFAINSDGSLTKEFQAILAADPTLQEYEEKLLLHLQILVCAEQNEAKARSIITKIREMYSNFGYYPNKIDKFKSGSTYLGKVANWFASNPKTCEFPFVTATPTGPQHTIAAGHSSSASYTARRGKAAAASDPTFKHGFSRGSNHGKAPVSPIEPQEVQNQKPMPKMDSTQILNQLNAVMKKPISWNPEQLEVATQLGMTGDANQPIWEVTPTFYKGDKRRPEKAYISMEDVLGDFAPALLTGPCFQPNLLSDNQKSYHITIDSLVITTPAQLKRLKTQTLAVTTNGDTNVIRANGREYNPQAIVPAGGGLNYNAGNEKHKFRNSADERKYMKPVYPYSGGYEITELQEVEAYDKTLLNDLERRQSQAGVLASAYVTVTAEGGFGGRERKPLDTPARVLYLETTGPHFEKYGCAIFKPQNGEPEDNSSAAKDFIVFQGAPLNQTPAFPHFYENGTIPSYNNAIEQGVCALGDGNMDAAFVKLSDQALFNRKAFQTATQHYLLKLVIPALRHHIQDKPCYLKAILFGGGYFAEIRKEGQNLIQLRSEVICAMLKGYTNVIAQGMFPNGTVIEFPKYGSFNMVPEQIRNDLLSQATLKGVHIVWTEEGDVCDFKAGKKAINSVGEQEHSFDPMEFEKKETLVSLGAADAMSWSGNEKASSSLESSWANNTNTRLVMNWWANPYVFERIKDCLLKQAQLPAP